MVMVFGVFDVIHDGHRHFLREAKKLGDALVVALALDSSVVMLKKRQPKNTFAKRAENLRKEMLADKIIAGDENLNTWRVVEKNKPNVIVLGYDQKNMAEALAGFLAGAKNPARLEFIKPFKDGSLHSSSLCYNCNPKIKEM